MSEQAAEAADQVGHVHGAQAENASDEHEGRVHAAISRAFHDFATRLRGKDPAAVAAEAEVAADAGGGLRVEKTEGEVPADASGDLTGASERLEVVKEDAPQDGGNLEHPGIP